MHTDRQIDSLTTECGALDDGAVDQAEAANPAQDLIDLDRDLDCEPAGIEVDPQMALDPAAPDQFGERLRLAFEPRADDDPGICSLRAERYVENGLVILQRLGVEQLAALRERIGGERCRPCPFVIRQGYRYRDVVATRAAPCLRHTLLPQVERPRPLAHPERRYGRRRQCRRMLDPTEIILSVSANRNELVDQEPIRQTRLQ